MKREGDKVLFDSSAQQERIEQILQRQKGADAFIHSLLEALGTITIATPDMWRRIRDELGDQLDPNESLYYSWIDRELQVKKHAKEL